MPSFHVRLSDDELAMLHCLTDAVRARYEHMGITMPVFTEMARKTTPSSALRALLAAWAHGQADTAFEAQKEAQDG